LRAAVKQLIEEGKSAERQGKRSQAASRYAQAAMRLRRRGRLAPARSLLERAVRLSPASPKLYVQLVLLEVDERRLDRATETVRALAERVRARPDRREEYDAYVERELKSLPSLWTAYRAAVGDAAPAAAPETSKTAERPVGSAPDAAASSPGPARKPSRALDELDEELTLSALIRKLEIELDLDPIAFEKPELPAGFVDRLQDTLRDARNAIDLGIAFVVMELPDVAASFFDRVAEDDVLYGEAQCLAAGAFAAAGDWLAALDRAQRSLRVPPRSPDVLAEGTYQLAWAYARLGDVAQSRTRLALLEKTFPHYRDLQGLRALLAAASTDVDGDGAPPESGGMPPAATGGGVR
jgi:tetratricopeptide (TPR) repeat protein